MEVARSEEHAEALIVSEGHAAAHAKAAARHRPARTHADNSAATCRGNSAMLRANRQRGNHKERGHENGSPHEQIISLIQSWMVELGRAMLGQAAYVPRLRSSSATA
jgi:hypothetical protein